MGYHTTGQSSQNADTSLQNLKCTDGIILESHLIVYRIMDSEIQVLRILHSHRSITKIKMTRGIKP